MTFCSLENERSSPSIPSSNLSQPAPVPVSPGREVSMPPQKANSFYSLISFTGMTRVAVPVTDFVWKSFAALDNVKAVLAGESRDILHVWVMIDDWTPEVRKHVYLIQKTIMKQLRGLNFDFYVVDLPEGESPESMVSDIPLVFQRA